MGLDEHVARLFHDAYERLAPEFGYRTRDESAVSWEQVPEKNRAVMVATVREVFRELAGSVEAPIRHGMNVFREMLEDHDQDIEDAVRAGLRACLAHHVSAFTGGSSRGTDES